MELTGYNVVKKVGEQVLLSHAELLILNRIRKKKLLFVVSAYFPLVGILIVAWFDGLGSAARWGDEAVERYHRVVPYAELFFFLLLTVYFARYYFRAVRPFVLDMKNGVKTLLYFTPETYKTPFFSEYFLKTGLKKRRLIRVSKEMYEAIQDNSEGCIAIAPHSEFVFRLSIDGKDILFNDKNESEY